MNTPATETPAAHAQKMDGIYHWQRHFYDVTRKYFLLGRDRLIESMPIQPGQHVLEAGCGTARNLILLARKHPQAHFYGLDASNEMLATAAKNIERAGLSSRITLKYCLAEELDAQRTFGLSEKFDAIFFSYSLSMIPTWKESLAAAQANLKTGGAVHIVDFWDQKKLPSAFRFLLVRWLALFHVQHRPELIEHLQHLDASKQSQLALTPLYRRYALLARLS